MQQATPDKPIRCPDAGRLLEAAGYVDVVEQQYRLPFCTDWPHQQRKRERERAAGSWYKAIINEQDTPFEPVSMINGLTMGPLTRNLGWTRAQVDDLVTDVLSVIKNENMHVYNVL